VSPRELSSMISPSLFVCPASVPQPVEAALSACGLTPGDVTRLVLVGGSLRIPKLRDTVVALFPKTTVVDVKQCPEEVTAMGACVQGQHLPPATAAVGAGPAVAPAPGFPAPTVLGLVPAAVRVERLDGKAVRVLSALCAAPASGKLTVEVPVAAGVAPVKVYLGHSTDPAACALLCTVNVAVVGMDVKTVTVNVLVLALRSGGFKVEACLLGGEGRVHAAQVAPGTTPPPVYPGPCPEDAEVEAPVEEAAAPTPPATSAAVFGASTPTAPGPSGSAGAGAGSGAGAGRAGAAPPAVAAGKTTAAAGAPAAASAPLPPAAAKATPPPVVAKAVIPADDLD
jgi:hypothetical protein